jgi:SAM-dependent methyltransferase
MPSALSDAPTPFDDGALYDVFFEDFDQGLDFYLDLAKAAKGPILDVACGTGRVMLPCLNEGLDVDGLDLAPAMLARLWEKAQVAGFHPQLHQASMAEFRLPRRYAMVMIPFNAFVHNLTTDDQVATLVRCREHLQPGGQLAFDTFFPGAAIVAAQDGIRNLEAEARHPETGMLVRMYDTHTLDRVEQLMHSSMEFEMIDGGGNVIETRRCETTTRWIYKGEMELLLRAAGFTRWQIFGDYDRRPLRRETDAMIVEAWAAG